MEYIFNNRSKHLSIMPSMYANASGATSGATNSSSAYGTTLQGSRGPSSFAPIDSTQAYLLEKTLPIESYQNPLEDTIENKLYILVPIYNFDKFIRKCLQSMLNQRYSNWLAILYNDGSTDSSKLICEQYQASHGNRFKVINIATNAGPAATKYNGIQHIKKIAHKSDIMMILDGDDYLLTRDAFTIINQTYITTKCWFTYGSFEGKWSNQIIDIPRDKDTILYRQISWRYGHPRTVLCHLLHHFITADFQYKGKWLTKCTDRPFIFNICEWAGKDRIQYIPNVIYYYRDHLNNTYKNVSTNFKREQLNYIGNQTPRNPIQEPIHVVMCTWKRNKLLNTILQNQNTQTVAPRIHLHLLNNNPKERETLTAIIEQFNKTKPAITVTLKHFENKLYGFQRFQYIKTDLLVNHVADYVIMVDDDQQFPPEWVESIYHLRQPQTYKSWWGTAFTTNNYWQKRHTIDDKFDYGGTGGSIIDTSIFFTTTKLWNVPADPIVYNIEDLWLSFVIRHHYGWDILCSFLPPIMKEEAFRGTDVVAQHKALRDKKQALLMYLIKHHRWKFIGNSIQSANCSTIYAESTNQLWIKKHNNEIKYIQQ